MNLEIGARSAADTVLQTNVDSEAVTREANDVILQANIDNTYTKTETGDRLFVKANKSDVYTKDETYTKQETGNRIFVKTNKTELESEVASRISAVSGEATARSDADNALATSLNTKTLARLAEVAAERSRIDALLEGTGVNLNQLKELVDAYTTSDSDILAQIGVINTNISNIQTQLDGTDTALNTLLANIEVAAPTPDYGDNTHRVMIGSSSGATTITLIDLSGNELYVSAHPDYQHLVGDVPYTTFNKKQLFFNGVELTNFRGYANGIYFTDGDNNTVAVSTTGLVSGDLVKFV